MPKIERIATFALSHRDVAHAACVKAGPWVFVNGIEAVDYAAGFASAAAPAPGLPLHGIPKHRREGDFVVTRLEALAKQAGTGLSNGLRLDQYYPTWKAVDPYHRARRSAFGDYIPPSTSVVIEELVVEGADISASLLAALPGCGLEPKRIEPRGVPVPVGSGFTPAVIAGDFVFIAGQTSRSADGSDPRAHVPAHSRWSGYEMRRQAEFVIDHRLAPALEAAGSSPGNVVKAQAYVQDAADIAHFLEVWNDRYGERQVALTVVPMSGLGLVEASLEINLIALRDGGSTATAKRVVAADIPAAATFGAPAVHAGDLLFLSGLMACDAKGALPALAVERALRHCGALARAEAACILDYAKRIAAAAGAALDDTARSVQFHTDLADFAESLEAWRSHAGVTAVPYCAMRVPAHPVPGCRTTLDLWIYAPR